MSTLIANVGAVDQVRAHYGLSGAALMTALKADGFTGRTLQERAQSWAQSQPVELDTVEETTEANTVDVVPEFVHVEPIQFTVPLATETNTMPEPELIEASDVVPVVIPAQSIPSPAPFVAPVSSRSSGDNNLTEASRQWAQRPADQRYWSIEDALKASQHHQDSAREVSFEWKDASLEALDNDDISLVLPDGTGAVLTNYSAQQLCSRIRAPHQYLAKLPASLAVDCLAHGIRAGEFAGGNALVHQNGVTKLRSLTSDKYARFWNAEVFAALQPLSDAGWKTPPARPAGHNDVRARRATESDCLTRSQDFWGTVKPGDMIAPSGIYASDHDMFAFLVNENIRIDDGSDGGLARGFFVSNSEVGAGALKVKAFYYRHVCSNHIVWGAEHVIDVSVRHVGTHDGIRQKFAIECSSMLQKLGNSSGAEDEQRIKRAQSIMLSTSTDGATARKETIEAMIRAVSGGRTLKPASGISLGMFEQSVDLAVQFADVDKAHPYSLWGAIQGLTRYSQSGNGSTFADKRAFVDALTPKLMMLAA